MNKIIKDAVVLCGITLIAGLLLGSVYQITKTPRQNQEIERKNQAYQTVFTDATDFEEKEIDAEQIKKYLEQKGITSGEATVDEVATAKKQQNLGYVITVTEHEGYGGDITFTVGIKQDGTICGVSVLTINETAGLGMKAKETSFLNQFKDKKVEKFTYTKNGATKENEIDAISGATITTKAMTKGVNAAIECFQYLSEES